MKLLMRVTAISAATALCAIAFAGPGTAQQDSLDDLLLDEPALEFPAATDDLLPEPTDSTESPELTELTDAEILEQALIDPLLPVVPAGESPEFLARAEAINFELERIFPFATVEWDPEMVGIYEIDRNSTAFSTPIDDNKCASEFQFAGELPEQSNDSVAAFVMCDGLAESTGQMEWMQAKPTLYNGITQIYVDHVELDGVIHTTAILY
ncbi:MAG: hypothetical protein Q4G50_10500 [Corynebacterium sp.]|uniref:hypothetical protein n=1 Tax=Corynebacterium sp. TaxID=1720 RepID=UPI0026E10DF0|nr:hypothetical protein [Corynebacterium sp.]MDO5670424.1 hypothetical protein [Corynebacterium sp.]